MQRMIRGIAHSLWHAAAKLTNLRSDRGDLQKPHQAGRCLHRIISGLSDTEAWQPLLARPSPERNRLLDLAQNTSSSIFFNSFCLRRLACSVASDQFCKPIIGFAPAKVHGFSIGMAIMHCQYCLGVRNTRGKRPTSGRLYLSCDHGRSCSMVDALAMSLSLFACQMPAS